MTSAVECIAGILYAVYIRTLSVGLILNVVNSA